MKTNLTVVLCVIALLSAACQSATPAPIEIPTVEPPANTPSPTNTPLPTMTPLATTTPLPDIAINLPEGDLEQGFTTGLRYTCHGCHVNELHLDSGPRFAATDNLPLVLERGEMRIALPEYAGRATTNLEYMIESVFVPEAFIVPGEWKEPMPTYYRMLMTDQELADILAWIASLR